VATKLAKEEAKIAGRELVVVQEICIEKNSHPPDVPY
jgi:hypothetical protein